MASKASSIQPRKAASRVLRCPGVACCRSWMGPMAMRGAIVSVGRGRRVGPPEAPQIFLRLPDILPDLLLQCFDRRKLDLIAQTIQKIKLDFRFRREFERMKIQQVRLNGKRIGAKGGPVADVRDRVKAFVA